MRRSRCQPDRGNNCDVNFTQVVISPLRTRSIFNLPAFCTSSPSSAWTHVAMLFCWLPANLHSLANALLYTYGMSKIRSTKLFLQEVGGEATYINSSSLFFTSCAWKDKQSIKRETAAAEQRHHKDGPKKNGSLDSLILLHTHSLTHSLGKARSSVQEREDSN